jgi:hypothetical protein
VVWWDFNLLCGVACFYTMNKYHYYYVTPLAPQWICINYFEVSSFLDDIWWKCKLSLVTWWGLEMMWLRGIVEKYYSGILLYKSL